MNWLTNVSFVLSVTSTFLATGCSGNSPPPEPTGSPFEKVTAAPASASTDPGSASIDAGSAPSAPSQMTADQCNAKGTVVYDMGDGKTHSPNYRCADGKPPIGSVPGGREGAVCCPK